MPRTASAADVSTFTFDGPRLAPPSGLTPEQTDFWCEITASLPPHHFNGANAPLLIELVRHRSYAQHLAEQLDALRAVDLVKSAERLAIFCELLKMQISESKAITSLSVKLRLSNSAHRVGRYDERRLHTVPSGPKPWENWGRRDEADDGQN